MAKREKNRDNDAPVILYVDDEETNLKLFRRGFRREFNIEITTSGFEALEIMKNSPVKVLITDQTMPGMKGTELIAKISDEFPGVVKIILTGYADSEEVIEAMRKYDVYECINKPYEKESMLELLSKVVAVA